MSITDKRSAIPFIRHANDVKRLIRSNVANARARWNNLDGSAVSLLKELTTDHLLCVALGDLILLEGCWYVTHAGLLRLARRKRCSGIRVQPVRDFCDPNHFDPTLVKAYATDFCGAKTLREATREQVENFVSHLADWAEKDRNSLLCQLNSYLPPKEGAA